MAASSIRRIRKGRHYRAPVLLDQRSLAQIGLAMSVLLVTLFMSGYMLGIHKAEARYKAPATKLALSLPEPVSVTTQDVGPRVPEQKTPGEYIDVDSADAAGEPGLPVTAQVATPVSAVPEQAVGDSMADAGDSANTEDKAILGNRDDDLAIGGPSTSDPGQAEDSVVSALYDTAMPDNARYSIQVGMYSQLANAERKVDDLLDRELNAYIDEYQNAREEPRYNVRFGYYADRRSARSALQVFEHEMAGTGYIVKL